MRIPWIRVHGALYDRPVVERLCRAAHIKEHTSVGVLVTFWSSVAQHSVNGRIADVPDKVLERWAKWSGRGRKRGVFAAWVRAEHQDAEGRVPEWDEYAGRLEIRREKERQRLADKRTMLRNRTHDVAPVLQNVATRTRERYGTGRYGTELLTPKPKSVTRKTPYPDWVHALVAIWTARVGRTTPKLMHAACKELVAEYTFDRVRDALEIYCSPDEGPAGARKPAWFAENFHRYRVLASTPLTDTDGVLTERGRKIMGNTA